MPILIALFGFFFPRVVIFALWFFAPGVLEPAFAGAFVWLLLGFLFLPLTTLVYAFVGAEPGGVQGIGLVVLIVAVLLDLGIVGGGARYRR